MNSKVAGCILELYLFELLLGFEIYYNRVCHISERNIETLDIMKIFILIQMLEVLMMKSRDYDKTLKKLKYESMCLLLIMNLTKFRYLISKV